MNKAYFILWSLCIYFELYSIPLKKAAALRHNVEEQISIDVQDTTI